MNIPFKISFVTILLIIFSSSMVQAGTILHKKVEKTVPLLKKKINNLKIVSAIKAENKLKKSLKEIKDMDQKWKDSLGKRIPKFIKKYLENDCAKYLKDIKKELLYLAEIFIMDDQGAIVCESDKTSDYWQGDEAKFIKAYNKGKGQTFIDKPEFDESTQSFLIQVSIPVHDEKNKVIGTATYGIDLDKL